MPNTAIRMPTVRNICRHHSSMSRSTRAFTTALSKDRLTSRMPRMTVISRAAHRPSAVCAPHQAASPRQIAVTRKE